MLIYAAVVEVQSVFLDRLAFLILIVMSLEQRFEQAAEKVKNGLSKRPSDAELLDLYGLFKQASVGDVNTAKPGALDLKGKYKWESWEKRKGMSKEEAMEKYIALVEELVARYA